MRVACATCGEEHDLSELEPTFSRPDAFFDVPADERGHRTLHSDDWCAIRTADDRDRRYYLRAVLPVPVRGEDRDCCWGVWVEVSHADYTRADALWDDPHQAEAPPFEAGIANEIPGYPSTLGLRGSLRFQDPTQRPVFRLDPACEHPLAREQREEVHPERVLEWLWAQLHP